MAMVLLVTVGSGSPMPAGADTCGTAAGVSVVVDFGGLGGGVQTGCAPGDPTSGLAALQSAGFGYSFVPNRPGFVCRVNSLPDPCNGAPAHAYWSYWYAPAGGTWTYSNLGAASRDPAPGSAEGWAFGDGDPPGVPPPQAAPPGPAPTPTVAPGPVPTPAAPVQPVPVQPTADPLNPTPSAPASTVMAGAAAAPAAGSPPSGTGRGSPPAGATDVPPDQVPPGGATSPLPSEVSPAAATGSSIPGETGDSGDPQFAASPVAASGRGDKDGGGSSVGAVAGLVLVAMVGAGAIGASRRRMRDPSPRT